MALKYVVKKTTFGFDKEKAEKYVRMHGTGNFSAGNM